MTAERVLGAVRELGDDDRRRRRRHDGERDAQPPADSDKGFRHGSIVGFAACRKGIRCTGGPAAAGSRGEAVEVETPHPRAAVKGLAERLDGRRLEQVEAVGKNLLLRFEGGLLLRSHCNERPLALGGEDELDVGTPWLVLRGSEHEAVLWNGPVARAWTSCYVSSVRQRRRAARPRGDARAPALPTPSERSATGCSTSASWPGSGTSGRPRRSRRRGSRPAAPAEVGRLRTAGRARGCAHVDAERLPRADAPAMARYRRRRQPCPRCGGLHAGQATDPTGSR